MSSPPASNRDRDQQFCLRWNNYQSNLTQVFNQLFQAETFVDVTLACDGHCVKAHRLVLAACSPYFMTVLTETPCSHPVIILQGVKWADLKAIVEFIYKGEINICQEQLGSLLRVAENLKIRGLADVGGEEAEAVLTSPSDSPRISSQFWADDTPRKRRRLSDEPRSRSRSRSPSQGPHTPHTPASVNELLEPLIDLQGTLSRGSSAASNPPPSLPSPSPVASLASSLSSLAHLHGPMPPPGPPLPPHLAHLPPLSPLSPLLNMHPMSRHHSPEDFEIRPGIAEMIREEERRLREFPEMAKLLESTHHWIGNPMADGDSSYVQSSEETKKSNFLKEALRKFCKASHSVRSAKMELLTNGHLENPHVKTFPVNNSGLKCSYRSKCSTKWTQDDLASALLLVRNGTPIKPAAEKFNIPVMTLWRRTRALGLVSSKVQCGFRYSSSKAGFSSLHALSFHAKSNECSRVKTKHSYSGGKFLKERSPLTESNCTLWQNSEDCHVEECAPEEKSHKENSPANCSSISRIPYSVIQTSSRAPSCSSSRSSSSNNSNSNQLDTKLPTKEFLIWLNCLGPKPVDDYQPEMSPTNSL